jgi:hypothetical protein
MKRIIVVASAATLAVACGQVSYTGECQSDKLAELELKIDHFPFAEEARAKAKDHIKLARESKANKDMAGCERHMQEARVALKEK